MHGGISASCSSQLQPVELVGNEQAAAAQYCGAAKPCAATQAIEDVEKTKTEELENARGYLLGSRPVRYENAGTLLSELQSNWLYGLPDNWITAYADNIRAVSLESAQTAWDEHIKSGPLSILVVGDKATILEGLQALELPIVELNSDGQALETK